MSVFLKTSGIALLLASEAEAKREEAKRMGIDIFDKVFIEASGRQVLLHGVNMITMSDPYIPTLEGEFDTEFSVTEQDLTNLSDWGINFVRLGAPWEAVERYTGLYDSDYLEKLERLVNKLGENGIHVMLDSHFQKLSKQFCGSGIPDFYVDYRKLEHDCSAYKPDLQYFLGLCIPQPKLKLEEKITEEPTDETCLELSKFDLSNTPEAIDLQDKLYDPKQELQDKFFDFWNELAKTFSQNPYVIGYDPFDKPKASTYFKHPERYFSKEGNFDERILAPFYREIFQKWENHDSNQIMFFQSNIAPATLNKMGGIVNPVGFQDLPGGNMNEQKQSMNFQAYCCNMDANMCTDGEPLISSEYECMHFHQKKMIQRKADALRLGVPTIITEFGSCFNSDACAMEINLVTDTADDQLVGWAYYQYKTFGNEFLNKTETASTEEAKVDKTIGLYSANGDFEKKKIQALSRAYLPYTQGRIAKMNFDKISGSFIASFEVDTDIRSPSILYVSSQFHYEGMEKITKIMSSGKELTAQQVTAKWDGPYFEFQVIDPELDKEVIEISCNTGEQSTTTTIGNFF